MIYIVIQLSKIVKYKTTVWVVYQFSSVQSLSCVWLSVTPWTAACQAPLLHCFLELAQPHVHWVGDAIQPSHPLLPLLLLPSIFPSIRVFSNELALCIRWPKHWSFSFNISHTMNTQDWSPLGLTCLISLQFKGLSRVFCNIIVQKHQFFSVQPSLWSNSHLYMTTRKTIALTIGPLLAKWYLCFWINCLGLS